MDKKKQILNFCYGFFGILLLMGVIYFFDKVISKSYAGILTLICLIPLAVLGIILWLALRNRNRNLGIGFLLGGILPFLTFFFLTNGCGIFM